MSNWCARLFSVAVILCSACSSKEVPAPNEPGSTLAEEDMHEEARVESGPLTPPSLPMESGDIQLVGQVVVDPFDPEAKRKAAIRIVRLRRPGEEDQVLSYAGPLSPIANFDGKQVRVTGHNYRPQGQALVNPHFRVKGLALQTATNEDLWVFLGEETARCLEVSRHEFAENTKSAGEVELQIDIEGKRFAAMGLREEHAGKSWQLRYRLVYPNPDFAPKQAIAMRMPGVTAWVEADPLECTL